MSVASVRPEEIHPSLWRASQLARGRGRVVDTGYPALSAELAGGGWPLGRLVDLLVQQSGIGEMRLLRPAFSALGNRPILLIQPPHLPNGLGLVCIGLGLERFLNVRARSRPISAGACCSGASCQATGRSIIRTRSSARSGTAGPTSFRAGDTAAHAMRRVAPPITN
ncbi:protein ImuA [Paraburkholderia kururiensis]|uniref:hypothetical protein n=1 Tax=Paraburkholderia kururiensis TaxID=984307 RepID=UPI0039A4F435